MQDFIFDLHVLHLQTLEWQIIRWSGIGLQGLYNFASCVKNESIYVYGGTNSDFSMNKKLWKLSYVEDDQLNRDKYEKID